MTISAIDELTPLLGRALRRQPEFLVMTDREAFEAGQL